MKAIVCTKYGSPDVLQLKEVAKPAPRDAAIIAANVVRIALPAYGFAIYIVSTNSSEDSN